ncbi:uncharacterized protein LOC130736902 [Lotus japonicus]|uniref:uncharacterized protein LOC130736902 n=1 Tax=Lotus japonicus TaxID=34305 RepID=UPI002588AB1D|nr:uncharacterized protein LOC130736902 [Lotus japonicus]
MNLGRVEIPPDLAQDVWAVGKLLYRGDFQVRSLRSVLQKLWGSSHHVDIREVAQNLFLFRFHNTRERNFAVRGGPWLFNRFNVVLQPFRVHEIPSQVPLDRAPYWVQVHNLPVWLRKPAIARTLAQGFAGFLDWDRSDANRFGDYFRMRVWVNVTIPLRRGQELATEGSQPFQVQFKYEKLRNYCYRCGLLDHVTRECELPPLEDETEANLPYGPWLRAWDGNYEERRVRPAEDRHERDDRARVNRGKGPQAPDSESGTNGDIDVDAELKKLAEE